jgi:hypothetical protein
MVKKDSKLLVIDASVGRAAGGENATAPTSVNCREFLKSVLFICHRVVMTPDIKEEWKTHQSHFSREWRCQMVSNKKWEFISEIIHNKKLWDLMDICAKTDKQPAARFKDICLIDAALATDDKIIISLDDNTARFFFTQAANEMDDLKDIIWVNPNNLEETPLEWLQNGAPWERARSRGFPSEESLI